MGIWRFNVALLSYRLSKNFAVVYDAKVPLHLKQQYEMQRKWIVEGWNAEFDSLQDCKVKRAYR